MTIAAQSPDIDIRRLPKAPDGMRWERGAAGVSLFQAGNCRAHIVRLERDFAGGRYLVDAIGAPRSAYVPRLREAAEFCIRNS